MVDKLQGQVTSNAHLCQHSFGKDVVVPLPDPLAYHSCHQYAVEDADDCEQPEHDHSHYEEQR